MKAWDSTNVTTNYFHNQSVNIWIYKVSENSDNSHIQFVYTKQYNVLFCEL